MKSLYFAIAVILVLCGVLGLLAWGVAKCGEAQDELRERWGDGYDEARGD